jgi:mRNA interferase MazF
MERSLKGSVVIIQFPFSDLTGSKKRPALIVADWEAMMLFLHKSPVSPIRITMPLI